MLRPVGSLPPSVYWRRRFGLLAALMALLLLTAWVLRSGGEAPKRSASTAGTPHTSVHINISPGSPSSGSSPSATSQITPRVTTSGGASTPPPVCTPTQLKVAAVVAKPSYHVGEQPTVLLQVTNVGKLPCVQDLADKQVELRVYNGESRVWGSHDCEVQPGTDPRTLAVGQAVRVSIIWSGLSSQPQCAGTRQRVGAGTYTLYALLSGHPGTAAQFSIS